MSDMVCRDCRDGDYANGCGDKTRYARWIQPYWHQEAKFWFRTRKERKVFFEELNLDRATGTPKVIRSPTVQVGKDTITFVVHRYSRETKSS